MDDDDERMRSPDVILKGMPPFGWKPPPVQLSLEDLGAFGIPNPKEILVWVVRENAQPGFYPQELMDAIDKSERLFYQLLGPSSKIDPDTKKALGLKMRIWYDPIEGHIPKKLRKEKIKPKGFWASLFG